MKHFLNKRILFFLIMISCLNIARSDAMTKMREANLERFKEKFDIQLTLYNGGTLPQLIPSVEGNITDDPNLLKHTKYLYLSALYKGNGVAYLTFDVKSSKNPSLKLIDHAMMLDGNVRQYELVCVGRVVMWTEDTDMDLDYEIKDVWFK